MFSVAYSKWAGFEGVPARLEGRAGAATFAITTLVITTLGIVTLA